MGKQERGPGKRIPIANKILIHRLRIIGQSIKPPSSEEIARTRETFLKEVEKDRPS